MQPHPSESNTCLCSQTDGATQASARAEHEFKNFHRLLCERFGYVHDDRDWKRDQASLIEWIANHATGTSPVVDALAFVLNVLEAPPDQRQVSVAMPLAKTIARLVLEQCQRDTVAP
ncbi:hypothetical protein PTKU64_91920 (plasmid) [Paraburkholderia terrae]|uniref:Uncharacterized protein n=2 Tax=Paraburkholderia terrae TaxID=311230 RepID=A0ABM7UC12_9BURK|nr:hypothetical protein PTKU64_91920 [Paraburkholderia terrae]